MFFVFDLQGNLRDIAGRNIEKHQVWPDKDDWAVKVGDVDLFRGTLKECQSYQNVLHGALVKAGHATLALMGLTTSESD